RDAIQRYARLGATSMDAESGNNWGVHGLGYYVANQLMWNPDADLDALRTDFFEQAFGPAAKPMRSYYDRCPPSASNTGAAARTGTNAATSRTARVMKVGFIGPADSGFRKLPRTALKTGGIVESEGNGL
ncbi:MAG: DUF4838 domain-containing protein, partial [Proteobacteria bacterium]|nr:DUF4838 domain-containing protein [Pseudomonadota bacterium]